MHKILVFISRILFRLLIFNLFLIFLPVAGFLYLDTYEKQLLSAQEDSMVQQGRLVAMALADQDSLQTERVTRMLGHLKGRTLSRIRIVDTAGKLLADSSALKNAPDGVPSNLRRAGELESYPERTKKLAQNGPETGMESWLSEELEAKNPDEAEGSTGSSTEKDGFSEFVYQIVIFFLRLYRDILGMPKPDLGTAEFYTRDKPLLGPEIKAALEGRYGATTRYSVGGQESIMMYSAIPIRNYRDIIGAVLVSQSTYRILLDLYEVRVGTLQITLFCAIFAVLMSIFLGNTIARPLKKLSHEAEAVLDKRGRLMRPIRPAKRLDEIGDLARSLSTLTQRLEQHI
ncbi:MAG: HAMP domain-containing protein, partial [Spirochaetaceae bacterium]